MLKNPEAGPSDTVPAMLTPGEAVIPASAAQDPDNIPKIKRMIAEGRMKNRIAEANDVPVNGKEAIMYDEKKLGFAGGNMNIKNNIFDIAESIEANEVPPLQDLEIQMIAKENQMAKREGEEFPEMSYKHLIPGLTDNYVGPLQFLAFKAMENFSLQPEFEDKKEKDLSKLKKQKAVLQSQLDKQKEQFELKKEGLKAFIEDKDRMGYGHGTMEVPAMVMMTPPKDPSMDAMEKMAMQQMGYEMKSKNRTRDTIEKIGLKHLEDTADVNMKQAALDETMRNYNMPVPMPMQAVPPMQGFQQGIDEVGDATVLDIIKGSIPRVPGLARSLAPDEYVGTEGKGREPYEVTQAKYEALKEKQAQEEQEKAEAATAQVAIYNDLLAQEQEGIAADPSKSMSVRRYAKSKAKRIRSSIPPSPYVSNPTFDSKPQDASGVPYGPPEVPYGPPEAPPAPSTETTKTPEEIAEEERLAEEERKRLLKGAPPLPKEDPTILQQLGQGLKEALDPKALVKGAVGYGLSSLLTQDPSKAAQAGLAMYSDELGRLDYDEALARSALGSYTPESIEEYKRTGDVSELVALPAAPPGYTLSDGSGEYQGKRVPIYKDTETQQQYFSINVDGKQSFIPVQNAAQYGISTEFLADYYDPQKVTSQFNAAANTLVDRYNTNVDDENQIDVNYTDTNELTSLYLADVQRGNMPAEARNEYYTQAQNALQEYYQAKAKAKRNGTAMPISLEAFYNKRKLYLETSYEDPTTGETIARLSYNDIRDADPMKVQAMVDQVKRNDPNKDYKVELQDFKADFEDFKKDNPKYAKKLAKAARDQNHSPFTWFVTQTLDGKDPVLKKFFE